MFVPKKIIKDNNLKSLRKKSSPVTFPLDDKTIELCQYLLEHLKISQDPELNKEYKLRTGVGLAACQIGIHKNIFAMYINDNEEITEHIFINPKIVSFSVKKAYLANGEGCLSIDKDKYGLIFRAYSITIKSYDLLLKAEIVKKFSGYQSIVVQHEMDHFQGILYYDHINKKNPDMVLEGAIKI